MFDTTCRGHKGLIRAAEGEQRGQLSGFRYLNKVTYFPSGAPHTSMLVVWRPTPRVLRLVGSAAPGRLAGDQASEAVGTKKVLRTCFTYCCHKLNLDIWRVSRWLWALVTQSLNPSGRWIIISYQFQTEWTMNIFSNWSQALVLHCWGPRPNNSI